MTKDAKWSFMVYMAGDNNLSDAGETDLEEMAKVGSSNDVNVIVEFDNAGENGTNRYLIQKESKPKLVDALGETDCGDPCVLNNFISWTVDTYPAERYALILWNHGGGWEPTEMDRIAQMVQAKGYTSREAGSLSSTQMKKTLFSTSVKKILAEGSSYERAICSDDGSGHSLDTIELGNVLSKTKETIGKPLDILGMDACLMSNLEVAYQAAPYVNYIVASEEEEPNEGWPYESVLRVMVDQPDIELPALSSQLVRAYIDYYRDHDKTGVTQSAFDLSKVKEASHSLDQLAGALIDHMPDASTEIWKAQKKSIKFFRNTLWDINHFLKDLAGATASSEVKDAALKAQAAFKAGQGRFIMAESHLGSWFDSCCGASIYLAPPPGSISKYYENLDFSKEITNWPLMLQQYHEAP